MDFLVRLSSWSMKGLSLLVFACLWRYMSEFWSYLIHPQASFLPAFITILVVLSGVVATCGLLFSRRWGFMPLYFFLPALSLFFDFSVLPYPTAWLDAFYYPTVAWIANLSVLFFSVWLLLHLMEEQDQHHQEICSQ